MMNVLMEDNDMAYEKQNFKGGNILKAEQLNHMEDGIAKLETSVTSLGTTVTGLNTSVMNMDTRVTALEGAGSGSGYPLPRYFVHDHVDYSIALPDATYDSDNGQIYTNVIPYGMSLSDYGSGLSPTGMPVVMVVPDATRTSTGTMPTMISVSDVELSSNKKSVTFNLRVYWRYEDNSKPFVKPNTLGIRCVCLYMLS
jgi:hypothetical protein